ncbi:MAG: hypothetical protein K2Y23_01400 [Cyanobacteria bacterium]|nr:hypothetical protein [Cyanobacteriota bacterium]
MTALDRVCALLDEHQIAYALIGAAALAARGVARSTFDIDLLTTDQRALDAGVWRSLAGDADVRRGDLEDPLAGVVRATIAADRPVDVVVGRHAWQTRAVARAERLGGPAPVALARDLVLLKLYAGGSQDLWDIGELLRNNPDSLPAEVDHDLPAMPQPMRDRWRALRDS